MIPTKKRSKITKKIVLNYWLDSLRILYLFQHVKSMWKVERKKNVKWIQKLLACFLFLSTIYFFSKIIILLELDVRRSSFEYFKYLCFYFFIFRFLSFINRKLIIIYFHFAMKKILNILCILIEIKDKEKILGKL